MAKVKDACCWCGKLCTQPAGFNTKTGIIVCSDECMKWERQFRIYFSDENIGIRNYQEHGVNPNHRGKHGKGKTTPD